MDQDKAQKIERLYALADGAQKDRKRAERALEQLKVKEQRAAQELEAAVKAS